MNMLTLNQFAQEIQKQARGGGGGQAQAPAAASHVPGAMTSRMLHPTLWSSNPYTGLMMAGGGLGLASGLLSADDDDNKTLRGLAGAGLGLAGTSVLNNMGAFDDALAGAQKLRGSSPLQNAVAQTRTAPIAEAVSAASKPIAVPKPPSGVNFLAANMENMTPGEIKDFRKLLEQQGKLGQFAEGSAGRLQAQLAKEQAVLAEQIARKKMISGAGAAGMNPLKRLGLRMPLIGSRIR